MHDYVRGKADWAVHGLPLEGRTAGRRRAIEIARKDIPTCGPRDRLGDVRERVRAAGQEICVVVNERGIVLGRLQRKAWEKAPESAAEDCMQLGPPTTRPDIFLHEVIERFRKGTCTASSSRGTGARRTAGGSSVSCFARMWSGCCRRTTTFRVELV